MSAMKYLAAAAASAVMALSSTTVFAQAKIKLEKVITGINTPLAMVQPPGDSRMFIVEQNGRIRILDNGKLAPNPFLDIRSKIKPLFHDFDERGLLGLAFHPKFKENGKFYVAYSAHLDYQSDLGQMLWYDHSNVVEEYTVSASDRNAADPSSARRIMSNSWPQFNHNGHWIAFGPDGMLYISTGDGGYANDWGIGHNVTTGNGQDKTSLNGKMLRIDVRSEPYAVPKDNPYVGNSEYAPEIWAMGLRNPWRCSFDMGGKHELICGDVGQNSYEEVNIITKGGNYGWRSMEGSHCFDFVNPNNHPTSCNKAGLTDPIIEYKNCSNPDFASKGDCEGISITGGYVYRGPHKPWQGKYFFGDWSKSFAEMDGQIFIGTKGGDGKWSMEVAEVTNMPGKLPYVLAFAQDANGEVYVLTSITTGPNGSLDTIYKIVP
jgi:glucose/arabinose dehydrogenase